MSFVKTMNALLAPPPQFVASVQNTPHIPRAPAPFATKEGYSKLLIGAVPTPIGEIVQELPRSVDCAYANARLFAFCWKKIVTRSPLVTMMLGLVSSAVVVATPTAGDHVRPSSSDRAT